MTSLTHPSPTPLPRVTSLSWRPQRRREMLTLPLSWFLQPSSLPSRQVSPPEHRLWPQTLSPAASVFCLWAGGGWGGRNFQPRGGGCAPLPQAPKPNQSPPPQARRVYKVRSAPQIPSLKLGRKWGRGGGGDKGAGCSTQLKFGPRLLLARPRGSPCAAPPACRPRPPCPRRGAGEPPGSGARCRAVAAQVPRLLPSGHSASIRALSGK